MFLLRRKSVLLLAIEIRYEISVKDNLGVAWNSLKHIFQDSESCHHREPAEVWIRGKHMDYLHEGGCFTRNIDS